MARGQVRACPRPPDLCSGCRTGSLLELAAQEGAVSRHMTSAPWGRSVPRWTYRPSRRREPGGPGLLLTCACGSGPLNTPWPGPGASQLILRGHPATRAVSLAPQFPVSPSEGEAQSSCLACQHDPRPVSTGLSPQGAPTRPRHRLFLCYRGMEGSFAILQTFPDVRVQPHACSGRPAWSRVPAVARAVGVSSHPGSLLPACPRGRTRPPPSSVRPRLGEGPCLLNVSAPAALEAETLELS